MSRHKLGAACVRACIFSPLESGGAEDAQAVDSGAAPLLPADALPVPRLPSSSLRIPSARYV
jgi:hypothetical protein